MAIAARFSKTKGTRPNFRDKADAARLSRSGWRRNDFQKKAEAARLSRISRSWSDFPDQGRHGANKKHFLVRALRWIRREFPGEHGDGGTKKKTFSFDFGTVSAIRLCGKNRKIKKKTLKTEFYLISVPSNIKYCRRKKMKKSPAMQFGS